MEAAAAAAPRSEFDRTEQIISQFLHKILYAVIVSRVPSIHSAGASGSRHSAPRKRDRWFHLALGDLPASLMQKHHQHQHEHHHHPHHPAGCGLMEPMVVDVVLTSLDGRRPESVVERWTAQCEPPAPSGNAAHDGSPSSSFLSASVAAASASSFYGQTYKKAIVTLRSLYATLRLLPAHRVFRMLSSAQQSYQYDLSYRVSSSAAPLSREEELRNYNFPPVETLLGQLVVSVQYRPSLAEFNFEVSSSSPPRIIADYVGSSEAEPVRSFPSSLPDRVARPLRTSSTPSFDQPHSWNAGPLAHHPLSSSQDPASASHKKGSSGFDEFRLSPSLSSSPGQSPPRHDSNFQQNRLPPETTTMIIPREGSPSESRFFRKWEALRLGDIYSNLHMYTARKGLKGDSGRYSTGLSSGSSSRGGVSSRLSIQDDLDDEDSYPFALDDDTSDSQGRSLDEKEASENAFPSKSRDAAVGFLVHMFKTAPALRHGHSSSQSLGSELTKVGTSSLFLSRKTSDALDELQSYKDMKKFLLSRSAIKL